MTRRSSAWVAMLAVVTALVARPPGAVASTRAATAAVANPPVVLPTHFNLARPDIAAYIHRLSTQGFDPAAVRALLAAAVPQAQIIQAISRPPEKTLQWWQYRAIMLTPRRIAEGTALWRTHRRLLDRISIEYHVAPEYLLAVLGVETAYGRITGHYRVIDALATLAFDYPPRGRFFRAELTDFLRLARAQGFDPLKVLGSYAGAMGALQFMPSSYLSYAVSADHGRHSDLWNSWPDIFASVANYLHRNGWRGGAPVLADARLEPGRSLDSPERLRFDRTLAGLHRLGLSVRLHGPAEEHLSPDTRVALLSAPLQSGMSYRVAFHNFGVIIRYNSSPLYAMAVCDLARALREQMTPDAGIASADRADTPGS